MLTEVDSAKSKLLRAREHFSAIREHIRGYTASEPYKVITEPNGEETLHVTEQPPSDIAILAGEIVYQLRSALDHLAFGLVKLNRTGISLPLGWEQDCEFPLRFELPKRVTKPPVPQTYFTKVLPGITRSAFTFIESVQPYRRHGAANALRILASLSNVDKHRHLNVTVPQVVHHEVLRTAHGSVAVSRGGLKHGAEIKPRVPPQPYPTVDLKRSFAAYVTFDEPTVGDAATLEVEHVLQVCFEQIETVIIPTFEQLLK